MSIKSAASRLAASDPSVSAWVSANAGSGKTRLLVERVLRLLLAGNLPSRLLCITYTKAAAAEMESRVLKELSRWAMAEEGALRGSLQKLTGHAPSDELTARARTLFARLADAPDGLHIQTIHAFCQSLLARFPLEAGVAPYFTVIDERTADELLKESLQRLFTHTLSQDDARLKEALALLSARLSEYSFQEVLREIVGQRRQLRGVIGSPGAVEGQIVAMRRLLGVNAATGRLVHNAGLVSATVAALSHSDKKNDMDLLMRLQGDDDDYLEAFLTKEGTPRKKLHTQALTDESVKQALLAEQEKVYAYEQARRAESIADATAALLRVAEAALALYAQMKRSRALLDYDDLILTASALLSRPGVAPWVLFKLDGGVDHILVDEAQDTSREQWQIVRALTQEFFAGQGRSEAERTLFVVGDSKQSIYRFQGAEPKAFLELKDVFAQEVKAAGKTWVEIELPESFRSTQPVLKAVDAVFGGEHIVTREDDAGRVELWPLVEVEKAEDAPVWEVPHYRTRSTAPQLLAEKLADTIAHWLERGELLESKGRAVQAGDILILVRKRSAFVDSLIKLLKRRGVPVAGIDRMRLIDNLAVRDLIALAAFVLLPQDDLNLAALLKSPLCNVSEEELFALAHGRDGTLWARVRERSRVAEYLSGLLAKADFLPPYEFFTHVLVTLGGRAKILGRMGSEYGEALDEFLSQALLYERSHTPSLQGFLYWLDSGETVVKRDLEQGAGEVRIMTVHGAKGLEAPIVIMPDTTQKPRNDKRLLWHEGLMLWCPGADYDTEFTASLRATRKEEDAAEYQRLLYVAMTRAEDRLYICGAKSDKYSEDCWYAQVEKALAGMELVSAQAKPVLSPSEATPKNLCKDPSITFGMTLPEEQKIHTLTPSRFGAEELAMPSPLVAQTLYQRGRLVHMLLQYLPGLPEARREGAAVRLLSHHGLSDEQQEALKKEVLAILSDTRFAFIFSPGSHAEVPVTGVVEVGGKPVTISGQIDRLAVGEREVWIVDYKTMPQPKEIPIPYLRQLAAYQALMRRIYPQKTVRCALLWTSGPSLTEVTDRLDAARLAA